MRKCVILAAVVFAFHINAAFGQTASDIERRYGKPLNVYSVGEHIWMTPEYTNDGQVCRMRLYPKRISNSTNYLSKDLPFDEFKNAVDDLFPVNTRGAKRAPFEGGGWETGGGAMWAIFTYERITLSYLASVVHHK